MSVLRFEPIYRRYLWGGRRLQSLLGKPLPDGDDYAESWEVVDRAEAQSVVTEGPWKGRSLGWLIRHHGQQLLGHSVGDQRFPLLFKFLDAHRHLSVQVHPDDRYAANMEPPDLGKTEAWVVLHADPGSVIYAGLREGVDRTALEQSLRQQTVESCLHRFEPRAGDCVFIPAGVVHALGGGLVVAEIQQSSDTTFRLFDWNRLGPDEKPRTLHIERALEVIDFSAGPVVPQAPQPLSIGGVEQLVDCRQFVMWRWTCDTPQTLGSDNRFHLVVVLDGELAIADSQETTTRLSRGDTALVSASTGPVEIKPSGASVFLDIFLRGG